jgi:hypothetical protein
LELDDALARRLDRDDGHDHLRSQLASRPSVTAKDTLDRIAALIALASSPQLEEARTAAHKACAMMREHGLVIAVVGDDGMVSRSVAAAAPGRPQPRRARERHTVIIFRCARCGRKVDRQGARCSVCIVQATPMGVWTVDCQGCGRSTPPGASEMEVNEIAFSLGFKIGRDGRTYCSTCARHRESANDG